MKKLTFSFCLLSFSLGIAQNINEGLLLHYKFDNDFKDTSENEYHGTNHGVIFTENRFGSENSAASFNGVDSYIEFPNLAELKPELPVSFSFWIKYNNMEGDDNYLFNTSFEENVSSGVYFNTQITTDKYAVNFGDGTHDFTAGTRRTYVSDKIIDTEDWHHVAVIIHSATAMKIYIDCREFGGDHLGSGGELEYSDSPGNLGRGDRNTNGPSSYFQGLIDDFYYWDRELEHNEISELCVYDQMDVDDFTINKTSIYPNPAYDFINVQSNLENITHFSIYKITGEIVLSSKYSSSSINISNLSTGMYFIKLYTEKESRVFKFIKN